MSAPAWWTEADRAELDWLVGEFIATAHVHRQQCSICRLGGPWCEPLASAFDGILSWRRSRMLRSRARHLRLREELNHLEQQIRRAA